MKKIVIILFSIISLFAVDYTEMSTQELIAMMGYVKSENRLSLERELKDRVKNMSQKERELYRKNLEKLKNGKK